MERAQWNAYRGGTHSNAYGGTHWKEYRGTHVVERIYSDNTVELTQWNAYSGTHLVERMQLNTCISLGGLVMRDLVAFVVK